MFMLGDVVSSWRLAFSCDDHYLEQYLQCDAAAM